MSGLSLRDRRARARAADQVFWARTLLPLLGLQGPAFTKAVTQLSEKPLFHPVHGEREFGRAQILAHVEQLKRMRLDQLLERVDKYSARPPLDKPRPDGNGTATSRPLATDNTSPPVQRPPARQRAELALVGGVRASGASRRG